MPTSYKSELFPPDKVPAYTTAHPVGSTIVLPDINTPGASIAYTVAEVRVEEAKNHPKTNDPLTLVTLVLQN